MDYNNWHSIRLVVFLFTTHLTPSIKISFKPCPVFAEHSTYLAALILSLSFLPSDVVIVS